MIRRQDDEGLPVLRGELEELADRAVEVDDLRVRPTVRGLLFADEIGARLLE